MMKTSAFESDDQLEDVLSEPTQGVIDLLGKLHGDIIVLGAGGKMGPTLARMARRASDEAGVRRRVIGVSRFSSGSQEALEACGVETVCCDLLNEEDVGRLPEAANVVFMIGRKFGSTGDEAATWTTNSYLPGVVCRRYRGSRIVAFSTGNVYGLTSVNSGGSREEDSCQPVGEYAMSCLGRERVFEWFSRTYGTRMALIRLNYACELRYGVLVDLAQRIYTGQPVDLRMGYLNTIWQGDANAMALRTFAHVCTPPWVVNVTGPEVLSVRATSERLGQLLNRPVRFVGTESDTALLSNASRALERLGPLRVNTSQLLEWVAQWVAHGGRNLGKPSHFECRDGKF